MPIYAYRCESCGHAKDVLQKMSDPLLTVCPVCGEPTFKKQVTAAGFQLKGSGWYATDFRGDGKGGKAADNGDKPGEAAKPAADGAKTAGADGGSPAAAPAPAAAAADKPAAAPAASGGGAGAGGSAPGKAGGGTSAGSQ